MSAVLDVVVGAAAAGGGSAFVAGSVLIWRMYRGTRQMVEDFRGEPGRPGVPARPGVMERLASGDAHFQAIDARMGSFETTLQHVADEMPKNGKPLAEKIDALYQRLIVCSDVVLAVPPPATVPPAPTAEPAPTPPTT